jgi:predicted enzyme related to lactoylglutathione lyase
VAAIGPPTDCRRNALPRITHFELPADNTARAIRFYETAFGWRFEKWEGPMEYWMVKTGDGPGIDGGLMKRQQPGQPPNNVIDVASLAESTKAIVGAGGTEIVPKMGIAGVGWVAYFTDTEQNMFGLIEYDPAAK